MRSYENGSKSTYFLHPAGLAGSISGGNSNTASKSAADITIELMTVSKKVYRRPD